LRFGVFCNLVPSVLREKGPPERREMESDPHAGTPARRTGLTTRAVDRRIWRALGFFVDNGSGGIENWRGGRSFWLRMTEGGCNARGEMMNEGLGRVCADEGFSVKRCCNRG
jgi:hypothetical protein